MQKRKTTLPYLTIFIMLFALCWLFPYSGDDWAWGSSIGIERLRNWFDNYNGRYAGNLIVLALTRSNFLKAFTMAICLTGIIYYICKCIPASYSLPISCLLMLAIPKPIFRQAIVWTAGFSNYVTSSFLVMVFIAEIYPLLDCHDFDIAGRKSVGKGILFGVLGVVSALIVENITVYVIIVSLVTVIFLWIRHRRIISHYVSFCTGSILGAVYMFSNSAYHSVAIGVDGYRTMPSGLSRLVHRILANYGNTISRDLIMDSCILNIAVLAACAYGYLKNKNKMNKKCSAIAAGCLTVMSGFVSLFYFTTNNISAIESRVIYLLAVLGTVLFAASAIVASTVIAYYTGSLVRITFLIGSAVCMLAPLLIVTPIGPRCFFCVYIIIIMLVLELVHSSSNEGTALNPVLQKCLYVSCTFVFLFYMFIFGVNYKANRARIELVRAGVEAGQTEISIPSLPYGDYLWCDRPTDGVLEYRYKLFYGIPDDIALVSEE